MARYAIVVVHDGEGWLMMVKDAFGWLMVDDVSLLGFALPCGGCKRINGLSWFIIFSPYFLSIRHEHLRFLSGDFLGWL